MGWGKVSCDRERHCVCLCNGRGAKITAGCFLFFKLRLRVPTHRPFTLFLSLSQSLIFCSFFSFHVSRKKLCTISNGANEARRWMYDYSTPPGGTGMMMQSKRVRSADLVSYLYFLSLSIYVSLSHSSCLLASLVVLIDGLMGVCTLV